MMIPILDAILEEVLSVSDDPEDPKFNNDVKGSSSNQDEDKNMRAMLCFSVSLACNIGGTATSIGKKSNQHFKHMCRLSKQRHMQLSKGFISAFIFCI